MGNKSKRGSPSQYGARASDIELLAAVVRAGSGGSAATDLAERLLLRFGGLRQLLQADAHQIMTEKGVGAARVAVIKSLPQLAQRYFEQSLPAGQAIRSPADTESFLKAKMRHLGHELFCCLFLDNRHRILKFDEMFRGI